MPRFMRHAPLLKCNRWRFSFTRHGHYDGDRFVWNGNFIWALGPVWIMKP